MIILWLIFTTAHGATSYNKDRSVLGGSMLFWGMLLGSIPNLLIAAGLVFLSSSLELTAGRLTRVGYVLMLIGLVVPAVIDLAIQALGAPFFVPVVGIGLIVTAIGIRHNPRIGRLSRYLLLVIGLILLLAFMWALVPSEVTDPMGGYRIYGGLAHFGVGTGWVLFGISVLRSLAPGDRY
ncbi:hypothetical protein [Arthrobacter sp. TB 23]|uniref:hypothetical protein n=1 Tax=Arthrobacter sp. TB 23 TaxID=494419 RepID=UPI0002FA5556|nr:hypothetical protein [Arthrobacter sp. TB 23]